MPFKQLPLRDQDGRVEFSEINPIGVRAIAGFISRARKEGGEIHVEGAYLVEGFF